MDGCDRLGVLLERLEELQREYVLIADHHAEFVREGVRVSADVREALDSAVAAGIAIGLGQAAGLARELLE